MEERSTAYTPLAEPLPVTEQIWPEGTAPLLCTRVMAYMHKDYIAQCIEGFLMQRTTFPVEFIIHDDASTDGTVDIIRGYEARYPRLIKGIYQTVNTFDHPNRRALRAPLRKAMRGKYMALCDGDDHWTDPLKLQKQVELLEAHPEYAGCFHYTQVVFEETGELGKLYGYHDGRTHFTAADTLSRFALCHPSAFVYRRGADQVPKWAKKIMSGDMRIFSTVASKGDLACIPEVMSIYRKHAAGFTETPKVLARHHHNRITLIRNLDKLHGYRHHQQAEEVIAYHKAAILREKKERREARKARMRARIGRLRNRLAVLFPFLRRKANQNRNPSA